MTLIIRFPKDHVEARTYITQVMFTEFLGIEIQCCFEGRKGCWEVLCQDGSCTSSLLFPDYFFSHDENDWLKAASLPQGKVQWISIDQVDEKVPSFWKVDEKQGQFACNLDILGTAFMLLTCYQERVLKNKVDQHGRFPAKESLLGRNDLLTRPVVNEYLEILWQLLAQKFPGIRRKICKYKIHLSHDVDRPFRYTGMPLSKAVKHALGEVYRTRNIFKFPNELLSLIKVRAGSLDKDPNNTFDWLMKESEKRDIKSEFYFLCGGSHKVDGSYSMEDRPILELLASIRDRGHAIGLHGSYCTMQNSNALKSEFDKLTSISQCLGINCDDIGGRQHYLRWQATETWKIWNEVGLDFDASVGFAQQAGFRTGCCYSYPAFDLEEKNKLTLIVRPLVFMDCSVFGSSYMGLNAEAGINYVSKLIYSCKKYHGEFVMLWHNSYFHFPEAKETYTRILDLAV